MKYLVFLFSFFCLTASAQTDTAASVVTVQLPVKAVVIFANYMSETPTWTDRKAPDYFAPLVGSGSKPDSLVAVVMKAGQLSNFVIRMMAERYGVLAAFNRSVLNNNPSITGYTALTTQISTKAAGNSSEKDAATYVLNKYNTYTQTMSDLYTQMFNNGLNWVKN